MKIVVNKLTFHQWKERDVDKKRMKSIPMPEKRKHFSLLPFSQKPVEFSTGSSPVGPQTEMPSAHAEVVLSRGPTAYPTASPGPTDWSSCKCCVADCGPASEYWWSLTPEGKSAQTSQEDHGPGSSSATGPGSDRGLHHVSDHHLNLQYN